MAQDFILIKGMYGPFGVDVQLDIREEDWTDDDYLGNLTAKLQQWGMVPSPALNQPAAAPRPAGPAPTGGGPVPTGNGGNGGCRVHGFDYSKQGYQGRGMECGFFAAAQYDGSRDKPSVMRSGEVRWYCASKW